MFNRLRALVSGSVGPSLELQAVQSHLGNQYAVELQNLANNKYGNDENNNKRAAGVLSLGRAIHLTKIDFKDDAKHHYFWNKIAKPAIDARFIASFGDGYDPKRFYVDAQDYAAVTSILPHILKSDNPDLAQRFIDTIRWLDSRDSEYGGYFGNTPYWKLHENQTWRLIDKDFNSVQAYWFSLLVADQASSDFAQHWTHTIVSENIEEIANLPQNLADKLVGSDIPSLGELLSLGCLNLAASRDLTNLRSKAFYEITEFLAPDSRLTIQFVLDGNSRQSVGLIKKVVPQLEIIQLLPEDSFGFNLSTQVILTRFISVLGITEMVLKMQRDEFVIKNPNETVPHLLHASR